MFRFEYKILDRVSSLAFLFRLNTTPVGGGSEIIFADMHEILSSEPVQAGYEGVVELFLKIQNFIPNSYFPYVWLGRTSNSGGYDVVDGNVGLPALTVNSSVEKELRTGLVSLAYETKKKRGAGAQGAMSESWLVCRLPSGWGDH